MVNASANKELVARLPSALRRYCEERHALWNKKCAKLERTGANRTGGQVHGKGGAAELRGITPSTLRSRMRKLGVVPGPREKER